MTEVAVLCGGVGAARFLRGLQQVVEPAHITAIVNTGDDTVMHGLSISPDLDTITYTLAGAIDAERGWGLAGETWQAMAALSWRHGGDLVQPRGQGSGDAPLPNGAPRRGGDANHDRDEIAGAWQLAIRLLPMTDDRLATVIELASGEEVSFQDYFVRLRHSVPVRAVRFIGDAAPTSHVLDALSTAATIVIAPSNPIVSIGPVRSLPGIDELLIQRRDRVVAVSPIVGGAALKGPADHMLAELGHEPSVVGVARLYAPIAAALVIDPVDADRAAEVETAGMRAVVTSVGDVHARTRRRPRPGDDRGDRLS